MSAGVRLLAARQGVLIRLAEGLEPAPGSAGIVQQDDLKLFTWIPTAGMARPDATAISRADQSASRPPGHPAPSLTLSNGALHPAISFPLLDLRLFSFQLPDGPYVGLSLYVGEDAATSSAALPILWILARKGEPKERIVDLVSSWFRDAGLVLLRIATAQNPTYTVLPPESPLVSPGTPVSPSTRGQKQPRSPAPRMEADVGPVTPPKVPSGSIPSGIHHFKPVPPLPPRVAGSRTPEPSPPLPPKPDQVEGLGATSPGASSSGHGRQDSQSGVGKLMDDVQFSILERFAKITRTTQNRAVDLLDSMPAARQAVGLLPQEYVAKVLPAEEAARIAEEFEPARNYISHFAEDMLGSGKRRSRRPGDVQMEDLPAEESDLGDFEVVEFDDMPLDGRDHHRTGMPISPELFLSWFDKEGRLEKTEDNIREHVFCGGIDMDIRPALWPYLLGVYPFDSTEAERMEIKKRHEDEYFELERTWKQILRPPTAEGSPILGGVADLPAPPSSSAEGVLDEIKHQLESPTSAPRTATAGDEAEGQDVTSALRERKYRIEKDVVRTDRNIPFFAGDRTKFTGDDLEFDVEDDEAPPNIPGVSTAGWNTNLAILRDILVTYAYREFDLGYVQGMSDLLAPVLAVVRDEVESFWCFAGFMHLLKANFYRDQSGMRTQLHDLEKLVKFLDPKLHNHLERIDALNFFFCFRWLLIWFKREFDFTDIMRLWEVLWSHHLTAHFHLFFAVAVLQWKREELLACKAFDELLKCINDLSGHIPVEETLELAEELFYKFKWKLSKWEKDPDSVHLPFDAEGNSEIALRAKEQAEAAKRAATEIPFELPKFSGPLSDIALLAKCGLVWKRANGWILPDGAIEAGGEYLDASKKRGTKLFICRTANKRGMYLGKGPLGNYLLGGCNYSFQGKELSSSTYEVLCLNDTLLRNAMLRAGPDADPVSAVRDYAMHKVLDWVPASGTLVDTEGCVNAGCVDSDGEPLYIARAEYREGVHVGYVREADPKGGFGACLTCGQPSSNTLLSHRNLDWLGWFRGTAGRVRSSQGSSAGIVRRGW